MTQKPDFEELTHHLIETIKEFQIKLGYAKESIQLYYPLESLNRLLETELDAEEMLAILQEYKEEAKGKLGELSFSRNGDRFCIRIPEDGVEYVHEKVKDTGFLKEFIETLGRCNINIDDVLKVFRRYSGQVVCEKMESEEFDYLIYFGDEVPDRFRYCIKFEECGAIYHRFTAKDYEAMAF